MEMENTYRASISAQNAVTLTDSDGETKYIVGLNKSRYQKGSFNLTPIGGGLSFRPEAIETFTYTLGVKEFERPKELKATITLPHSASHMLLSLLLRPQSFHPSTGYFTATPTETSLEEWWEETQEEELTIIPGINESHVIDSKLRALVITPTVPGKNGKPDTIRYQYICETKVSPQGADLIYSAVQDPTSGLFLLSPKELLQPQVSRAFRGAEQYMSVENVSTALLATLPQYHKQLQDTGYQILALRDF